MAGPRLVSDPEQSSAVSEAPFRRPWHAPELYNQIVQAGLDGARAMANFDNGRLRMVSNVYVRVDVVLGIYEKVLCPFQAGATTWEGIFGGAGKREKLQYAILCDPAAGWQAPEQWAVFDCSDS